jgi:hypothetical protein
VTWQKSLELAFGAFCVLGSVVTVWAVSHLPLREPARRYELYATAIGSLLAGGAAFLHVFASDVRRADTWIIGAYLVALVGMLILFRRTRREQARMAREQRESAHAERTV